MKLEITGCRAPEVSKRAHEVSAVLEESKSPVEVAAYLHDNFKDDFFEVENLSHWTSVLSYFEDFLVEYGNKMASCDNLDGVEAGVVNTVERGVLLRILRFLCLLLKSAKDKRLFLSLSAVQRLMRSVDMEVAILASEVLFNVCIPSSSVSNSLNDDWIDSVEIPDDIAQDALTAYESLSLMSTEFGLTEYLHGHQPTFLELSSRSEGRTCITLRFPPRRTNMNNDNDGENNNHHHSVASTGTGSGEIVKLVLAAWNTVQDVPEMVSHLKELKRTYNLTSTELWTVFNIQCTLFGFHQSAGMEHRLQVVKLRLHYFFLLVHSKIPPAAIQEHMRLECPFLQDLVQLSDITSEAMEELSLPRPISLAYVTLENVLGLLENKLRRRSSFVVQSNILQLLGLARNGIHNSASAGTAGGGQYEAWSAIVLASCSVAPTLLANELQPPSSSSSSFLPSPVPELASGGCSGNSGGDSGTSDGGAMTSVVGQQDISNHSNNNNNNGLISSTGKFLRIGLELYALSLSTREASNVVADMPLVGAIVGIVQSALPHLERLLLARQLSLLDTTATSISNTSSTGAGNTGNNRARHGSTEVNHGSSSEMGFHVSAYDVHLLLVTAKALYCLELTIEKADYVAAFRESDGITVVLSIIELFSRTSISSSSAGQQQQGDSKLYLDNPARNVLESALSALFLSLQKSRVIMMMHGNMAETGVRVVYETYFSDLCCKVFRSDYHGNELVWSQLVSLIKEVITIDPAYLAHFLASPYAALLQRAICLSPPSSSLDSAGSARGGNSDGINKLVLFPSKLFAAKPTTDLESFLVPLTRLAMSICITEEGRQYFVKSRIVEFILEAILQPTSMLPVSLGIYVDRIAKIGKLLGNIMLDCEEVKDLIKSMLSKKLLELAREAQTVMQNGPLLRRQMREMSRKTASEKQQEDVDTGVKDGNDVHDDDDLEEEEETRLDTPRMQTLQRLTNMCVVVESCFTERRMRADDLLRDVMSTQVVQALIGAYALSLPPDRQLFAQMALRHVSVYPHFGHSSSAKAISSLLKLVASQISHSTMMLTLISSEIDNQLNNVSSSKQALRAEWTERQSSLLSLDENKNKNNNDKSAVESMVDALAAAAGPQTGREGGTPMTPPPPISDPATPVATPAAAAPEIRPTSSRGSRRRSRGSSWGSQSSFPVVLVGGVLDCLPHKCVVDPAFKSDMRGSDRERRSTLVGDDRREKELEKQAATFIRAVLNIEWLSIMMSHAFRTEQRLPQSRVTMNCKDTLRRLFAFHKSSTLEVCRFAAQRWQERPLLQCRVKRAPLDTFCRADSSEDVAFTARQPSAYQLRVSGSGGALVREGIEIEGSRVVLVAELGSSITAYERRVNAAGIMRYRTAHGWISEFRRDHQRSPIVELQSIDVLTEEQVEAQRQQYQQQSAAAAVAATTTGAGAFLEKPDNDVSELLTLRESASCCLARVNTALRQVAVYLSRATSPIFDSTLSRYQGESPEVVTPVASMLSISLSKITKGFLSHPRDCLEEGALPALFSDMKTSSLLPSSSASASSGAGNSSSSIIGDRKENDAEDGDGDNENATWIMVRAALRAIDETSNRSSGGSPATGATPPGTGTHHSGSNSSSNDKNKPRGGTKESSSSVAEEVGTSASSSNSATSQESVYVDAATMCLYFGAAVKNIILPVLDDKNGNFNLLILRTLSNHGVFEYMTDALVITLLVLNREIGVSNAEKKNQRANQSSAQEESLREEKEDRDEQSSPTVLSRTGRCALHALPAILGLFRRLVNRDLLNKSCYKHNSSGNARPLMDEVGPYQAHELYFSLLQSIFRGIYPIFRCEIMAKFPSDIQYEWLEIVGELVHNLATPMPTPAEVSSTAGGSSKPNEGYSASAARGLPYHARSLRGSSGGGGGGTGSGGGAGRVGEFDPAVTSERVVNMMEGMGFVREHVMHAISTLSGGGGSNSRGGGRGRGGVDIDQVTQYLLNHPWQPPQTPQTTTAAATGEDAAPATIPATGTASSTNISTNNNALTTPTAAALVSTATPTGTPNSASTGSADGNGAGTGNGSGGDADDRRGHNHAANNNTTSSSASTAGGIFTSLPNLVPDLEDSYQQQPQPPLPPPSPQQQQQAPPEPHWTQTVILEAALAAETLQSPPQQRERGEGGGGGNDDDDDDDDDNSNTNDDNGVESNPVATATAAVPPTMGAPFSSAAGVSSMGATRTGTAGNLRSSTQSSSSASVQQAPRTPWSGSTPSTPLLSATTTPAAGGGGGGVTAAAAVAGAYTLHGYYYQQSDTLAAYTLLMVDAISANVLAICTHFEAILQWDTREPHFLFPFVVELLLRLKEQTQSFQYVDIFQHVVDRIHSKMMHLTTSATNELSSTGGGGGHALNVYGLLYFLTSYIQNPTICKRLMEEGRLNRTYCVRLVQTLQAAISNEITSRSNTCGGGGGLAVAAAATTTTATTSGAGGGVGAAILSASPGLPVVKSSWPRWMSASLVLLYEMLSLPAVTRTNAQIEDFDISDSSNSSALMVATSAAESCQVGGVTNNLVEENVEEEKEEEGAPLVESKMQEEEEEEEEEEETGRHQHSHGEEVASSVLMNQVLLLPDTLRSSLLTLCLRLVSVCCSPDTVPLSHDAQQGLFIVLLSLLGSQSYITRFVQAGAVKEVFLMHAREPALEHRRAQARVLAMIATRCMETEAELQQSFGVQIRALHKEAQKEADKCMPLAKFIERLTPFLLRSPEDFWKAVGRNVSIVKVVSPAGATGGAGASGGAAAGAAGGGSGSGSGSSTSGPGAAVAGQQNDEHLQARRQQGRASEAHEQVEGEVKAAPKVEMKVRFLDTELPAVANAGEKEPDSRAYATLRSLLVHIVSSSSSSSPSSPPPSSFDATADDKDASGGIANDHHTNANPNGVCGALEAVADAVLSLRRAPEIIARLVTTERGQLHLTANENFVDFLLAKYFLDPIQSPAADPQTSANHPTSSSVVPAVTSSLETSASCRLLVALCAFRGPSRTLVLDAVLDKLRGYLHTAGTARTACSSSSAALLTAQEQTQEPQKQQQQLRGGDGSDGVVARALSNADKAAELKRVFAVSRLANLISVLIRSSIHPQQKEKSGHPQNKREEKGQGVSLDTVHYLIEHGQLLHLLTQALSTIPLHTVVASNAVASILDLIELITRPKLQAHLEKITTTSVPPPSLQTPVRVAPPLPSVAEHSSAAIIAEATTSATTATNTTGTASIDLSASSSSIAAAAIAAAATGDGGLQQLPVAEDVVAMTSSTGAATSSTHSTSAAVVASTLRGSGSSSSSSSSSHPPPSQSQQQQQQHEEEEEEEEEEDSEEDVDDEEGSSSSSSSSTSSSSNGSSDGEYYHQALQALPHTRRSELDSGDDDDDDDADDEVEAEEEEEEEEEGSDEDRSPGVVEDANTFYEAPSDVSGDAYVHLSGGGGVAGAAAGRATLASDGVEGAADLAAMLMMGSQQQATLEQVGFAMRDHPGMEVRDLQLPSTAFVTPPDARQQIQASLAAAAGSAAAATAGASHGGAVDVQLIVNGVDIQDPTADMVTDMINRLRYSSGGGVGGSTAQQHHRQSHHQMLQRTPAASSYQQLLDRVILADAPPLPPGAHAAAGLSDPSGTAAGGLASVQELLPQGVALALEVGPPTLSHPMLSVSSSAGMGIGGDSLGLNATTAAAVATAASGVGVGGAGSIRSYYQSVVAGGATQPYGGPRSSSGLAPATAAATAATAGGADFFISGASSLFSVPWLPFHQYPLQRHHFDHAAAATPPPVGHDLHQVRAPATTSQPAVWPYHRRGGGAGVGGGGGGMAAVAADASASESASHLMTRIVQQQLEEHLIDGIEVQQLEVAGPVINTTAQEEDEEEDEEDDDEIERRREGRTALAAAVAAQHEEQMQAEDEVDRESPAPRMLAASAPAAAILPTSGQQQQQQEEEVGMRAAEAIRDPRGGASATSPAATGAGGSSVGQQSMADEEFSQCSYTEGGNSHSGGEEEEDDDDDDEEEEEEEEEGDGSRSGGPMTSNTINSTNLSFSEHSGGSQAQQSTTAMTQQSNTSTNMAQLDGHRSSSSSRGRRRSNHPSSGSNRDSLRQRDQQPIPPLIEIGTAHDPEEGFDEVSVITLPMQDDRSVGGAAAGGGGGGGRSVVSAASAVSGGASIGSGGAGGGSQLPLPTMSSNDDDDDDDDDNGHHNDNENEGGRYSFDSSAFTAATAQQEVLRLVQAATLSVSAAAANSHGDDDDDDDDDGDDDGDDDDGSSSLPLPLSLPPTGSPFFSSSPPSFSPDGGQRMPTAAAVGGAPGGAPPPPFSSSSSSSLASSPLTTATAPQFIPPIPPAVQPQLEHNTATSTIAAAAAGGDSGDADEAEQSIVAGIAFDSLLLSAAASPLVTAASEGMADSGFGSGSAAPAPAAATLESTTTTTTTSNGTPAVEASGHDLMGDGGITGSSTGTGSGSGSGAVPVACPPDYDEEVFYSLPTDMQLEILQAYREELGQQEQEGGGGGGGGGEVTGPESAPTQGSSEAAAATTTTTTATAGSSPEEDELRQLIEFAGMDFETISSLPEGIREEVIEQARRERQQLLQASGAGSSSSSDGAAAASPSSSAQEMDNASFLASLTPDLRAEVLLTAEPDFLASLPPNLVAEAQMLRERAASSWQRRELMSSSNGGGGGRQQQTAATTASGAMAGSAAGGGGGPLPLEDYDEEDDEEEDDDDDDDDDDDEYGEEEDVEDLAAYAQGLIMRGEDPGGVLAGFGFQPRNSRETPAGLDARGRRHGMSGGRNIGGGSWGRGSGDGSSGSSSSSSSRSRSGLMRIPASSSSASLSPTQMQMQMSPPQLGVVIAKYLLQCPKQVRKSSTVAYRILHNLSGSIEAKDLHLKLLVSLVVNQRHVLEHVVRALSSSSSGGSNRVGGDSSSEENSRGEEMEQQQQQQQRHLMAMLSNASAMSDVEFDYGNGRKPALIRTGSKSSNGTDAMSIMSAGPMVAAVGDNDEDDAQPPPPPPPPPSVVMATATASSARIDVSQEAAQRIVAVLLQLVMGNAAYVYLLLAARDGRFAMSPTALKAAAVTVVPSPPPPPPPSSKEEEKEEEKLQQEKEEEEEEEEEEGDRGREQGEIVDAAAAPAVVNVAADAINSSPPQPSAQLESSSTSSSSSSSACSAGSSTNSLLELVIELLGRPLLTGTTSDLESLTNLLALATGPLDALVDETVVAATTTRTTTTSTTSTTSTSTGDSSSSSSSSSSSADANAQEPSAHTTRNTRSSAAPADAPASVPTVQVVVPYETKVKDAKQQAVSLPVPRVVLSRASLGHLCDVLLSDLCSKRVLQNVSCSISRLSKIAQNHARLLELIVEVMVDLADQSQLRLQALAGHLEQVRSSYLRRLEQQEQQQHDGSSPKDISVNSLKTSFDGMTLKMSSSSSSSSSGGGGGVGRRGTAMGSAGAAAKSKGIGVGATGAPVGGALPVSLLPLGESGGRHHERLLRVVQTLHSMALKTKQPLSEVLVPAEALLVPLWRNLDSALFQLKYYLVGSNGSDEDEEEQSAGRTGTSVGGGASGGRSSSSSAAAAAAAAAAVESSNTETIRPQGALTSILSRLLPAIEAFFLAYASDFLLRAPTAAPTAPAAAASAPLSTTTANTTGTTAAGNSSSSSGGSSSSSSSSSSIASADLIPLSSMPGNSYRTSTAYMRNNLSLFSSATTATTASSSSAARSNPSTGAAAALAGGGESDPVELLQTVHSSSSVNSFRKQTSLNSLGGTGGSFYGRTGSVLSNRGTRLLQFVQAHRGLLNLIVKARPALLNESLSSLVRITQLRAFLKFDNKRKYFFAQLKLFNQNASAAAGGGRRSGGVHLQIRRHQVFEDSFHQLRMRTAEEMRGRLQVNFYGEEGVDAGGLSREWFVILAREIFNPNYALFTAAVDGATFQPNPLSMINTNHLDYFKFVGRVIGKAICDGQLMDAHFTRSFYKHVLGIPVDFQDIEATDPDYYKTLKQIMENPLEYLMLDLTFSAEIHKFGQAEVVDLIPNGRNIPVTDENKGDYIRLVAHHRMTAAIRAQIDSFLQGFYDLVPAELVCLFSPAELELLICGLPEVDIDELHATTEYHQYKASDPVIGWFWATVREFNREERAAFLHFVTGTSKVPLGGFANLQGMRGTQRFSIHKSYGDVGLLPTAHTCFNQLDLPNYPSQEVLKEKLIMAISEGSEGFGFA